MPAVRGPTSERPANALYLEGFGAAVGYSFDYERALLPWLALRAGLSFVPSFGEADAPGTARMPATNPYLLLVPLTASVFPLRSGRSALEVGGGVTLVRASGYSNGDSAFGPSLFPIWVGMIGYRNEPAHGSGFMFRAGAEVLAARGGSIGPQGTTPENLMVFPWPYVSVGTSF